MISFDDAQRSVLALARAVGAERVFVGDADDRVLFQDLVAGSSLPAFDHSAMDGYAVRQADFADAVFPIDLPLAGESAAGGAAPELQPRSTCRIFTGAELPTGADAVVMQEDVERLGTGEGVRIRFASAPAPSAHIRRKGADLEAGSVALAKGTRLGPGKVALAVATGHATLLVHRRPIVTIVGSGDELRAPGETPRPGSIVESNGHFVGLAARRAGAATRLGPFMRDDPGEVEACVRSALRGTDVLVTIGGVSVGDHDVVRPALEAAGVRIEFYKVAMKPGKPVTVGAARPTVVLGLPGNPASASLTFLLFGVPLIRALAGEPDPLPLRLRVPVRGAHRRKPGRTEFVRARLSTEGGALAAAILPNQASGAVTSFARADALVIVPEAQGDIADGEVLDVIRIADMWG